MIPNADITIYNKYTKSRAEKFQRSVVTAVVWQDTKNVNKIGSAKLQANSAAIFIPLQRGADYKPPTEWKSLTDETRVGKWTMQEGDVIVRGNVTDEITEAIPATEETEAVPAFTLTDLRAKYYFVVEVNSVDYMDEGSPNMRHWEIGCK